MSSRSRKSSSMAQTDTELPGYVARASNTTEHQYQLEDSKGQPWLWLTVKSRSKEAKQLPLFFEHDTISGTVEVDLDKAEGSKGVLISVGPVHANLSCRASVLHRTTACFVVLEKVRFPFWYYASWTSDPPCTCFARIHVMILGNRALAWHTVIQQGVSTCPADSKRPLDRVQVQSTTLLRASSRLAIATGRSIAFQTGHGCNGS